LHCSVLLVLVLAACDTDTRTEPESTRDAALANVGDDGALDDTPEMRDAQASPIAYFATKPLCASEVAAALVGGDGICSLQVPSPDASQLEFAKVNLILRVGGARVQVFEHVSDSIACGALQAWHYDDASNPARLVLCTEACALASSDPDTQIELVLGCDTRCVGADKRCETSSP
jgi:hypothetical protein